MWMLLIFAIGSHEPIHMRMSNGVIGNPAFHTQHECEEAKSGIAEGYYGECKEVPNPEMDEEPGEAL
jgi:hypothetical protein